ncbi:MAG: F0F1 ATP synthase subunit epsilon [Acidobacteriota bacterium]|jgi:F-type H+-transporting ATPase subunit epsilon
MADSRIQLEVVTPERAVLDLPVDEVVLPGQEGYLGVRPGHTPLLVALGVGELSYRAGGGLRYLALTEGFAEVLADRVSVLIRTAETAEEIDRSRAEASRERAEKVLEEVRDASDEEFRKAEARLARAVCRISVSGKRES